jgi:hypothetical protein
MDGTVAHPLIAIAGSIDSSRRYDPPLRDADRAEQACADLGRELAVQGCHIVVYSSEEGFAEAPVVRGYVESGAAESGSIHVRSPMGATSAQFPEAVSRRDLFDLRVDPSPDWEVAYYRSLIETQGLILIGGGRSTLVTGLMALTFGIPMIAVATFGGNAEKAWAALERVSDAQSKQAVSAMAEPWHAGSAAALVRGLLQRRQRIADEAVRVRREEIRRSRRTAGGLLVAGLLLVLAVVSVPVAFAWSPGTAGNVALLTLAPLLSAAAGALIRNTLDGGTEWVRPAVLGLAAGAISALLFIAAQLATTPDALAGDGAQRLLFFVVPVGFVAGLTFDAVYAKLRATDVTQTSVLHPGS